MKQRNFDKFENFLAFIKYFHDKLSFTRPLYSNFEFGLGIGVVLDNFVLQYFIYRLTAFGNISFWDLLFARLRCMVKKSNDRLVWCISRLLSCKVRFGSFFSKRECNYFYRHVLSRNIIFMYDYSSRTKACVASKIIFGHNGKVENLHWSNVAWQFV